MKIPVPSPEEKALSDALNSQLRQNSPCWFLDFMQGALYSPQLGYYQNTRCKFGKSGDFITAPTLSSAFAKTLSKGILPLLKSIDSKQIWECGGGTGDLAADLLLILEEHISHYFILELSASLMAEQKATLQKRCPQYLNKVQWISALPSHFTGVIIANEVLDAMPVHRFKIGENREILAQKLEYQNNHWLPRWEKAPQEVIDAVQNIESDLPAPLEPGFESEWSPWVSPWVQEIAHALNQGFCLFIDYGVSRTERYHPYLNQGTLRSYHKHHLIENPFIYPGLQDITCHVDFTQVALAASEAQLKVNGYCSQSAFLLSLGILNEPTDSLLERQAIQQLISPIDMGEAFKVMLLSRAPLPPEFKGFELQNDLVKL